MVQFLFFKKKKRLNVPVLNLFNKVKFSIGMRIDLIARSGYLINIISLPVVQVPVEFSLVPMNCMFFIVVLAFFSISYDSSHFSL